MNKMFLIGPFCFRLIYKNSIYIPKHFLQFEIKDHSKAEYSYHLSVIDYLPVPTGKNVTQRPDLRVFETETGESRLIGIKGQDSSYAFYHEISEQEAEIFLAFDAVNSLRFDPVFTSLFALEKHLIQKNSMILHCAYIKYQEKAILFSAPSETGKTTQANLWARYRESETVNGDRALLRKIGDKWTACGWPVCGTSEICNLEDIPIYAVVMLHQGKKNHVERLSPMQAFVQLYSQITINQWNRAFVQKAVEMIEDFVTHVPVWQLTCDISEGAVQCLEAALFPGGTSRKGGIYYEV